MNNFLGGGGGLHNELTVHIMQNCAYTCSKCLSYENVMVS